MIKRYLMPLALLSILLLAACSGTAAPDTSQAEAAGMPETAVGAMESSEDGAKSGDMTDDGHDGDMAEPMENGDIMEESSDEAMMDASQDEPMVEMAANVLPAWQTIALTDAMTGETFTLGDFQGKTVFVEPMATWCSNCRAQQGEVRQAKMQFGDDVVFVGLSLETNLPSDQLAMYAQDNGFDWTYAVMPVDLLSQLADQFGRSITNAPSTPHFIIRPDGTFTDLSTGIDPADTIVAKIQAEQG